LPRLSTSPGLPNQHKGEKMKSLVNHLCPWLYSVTDIIVFRKKNTSRLAVTQENLET